jgi:hypothetical protein
MYNLGVAHVEAVWPDQAKPLFSDDPAGNTPTLSPFCAKPWQ